MWRKVEADACYGLRTWWISRDLQKMGKTFMWECQPLNWVRLISVFHTAIDFLTITKFNYSSTYSNIIILCWFPVDEKKGSRMKRTLFISIFAVLAAISALIALYLFKKRKLNKEGQLLNGKGKCLISGFLGVEVYLWHHLLLSCFLLRRKFKFK